MGLRGRAGWGCDEGVNNENDNDGCVSAHDGCRGEKEVVHIKWWQRALVWPLGVVARLWMRSLRFEISEESRRALSKVDEPLAFILWHNRLFVAGEIFRRFRAGKPLHALVSASKDGAWLEAFFDIVGMKCVRGSSSYNARESVGLLVGVLREGKDIGITPDGPRGPMYDFKGGGVIVARRARAAVALFGAEFMRAWRLRSWDRFYVPCPFSRVRLHCRIVPAEALAGRGGAVVEELGRELRGLNPE